VVLLIKPKFTVAPGTGLLVPSSTVAVRTLCPPASTEVGAAVRSTLMPDAVPDVVVRVTMTAAVVL